MKKRVLALVLTVIMGLALAASTQVYAAETQAAAEAVPGDYDDVTIKLSYATGDTGMDGVTAIEFERLVEEKSGGVVKIDRFPNCQLSGGDMVRHVEMLLAGGAFEMAIISENSFAETDPYFHISYTPFLFSSYEDAYSKFDSEGGELCKEHYAALGVRYFSTFPNGIMQLANNVKEIHTPEDMKNLKVRTYGDLQMSMMRDLGADPTQLSWSELYSALQTGAVNGQVNGYQTLYSGSMHEVQNYITELNVLFAAYDFLGNEAALSKLKPDTQALLEECAKEAAIYGRNYMSTAEAECKQAMTDYGVTIYVPTAEELQMFKDAVAPTREMVKEKVGADNCKVWGFE